MIKKRLSILVRNWDLFLLFFFTLTYILIFSNLSILRHNAFASSFDLANMSQTVWNTLHGRPFQLSGAESTISRFSIHADLILVMLSPFYLLWERAATLLIIQSVLLGLGAIPVYFLSRKILSRRSHFSDLQSKVGALSLVLAYLLNPGMEWINIYDFHGVSLAIPFLLSAFYFAYQKRWMGYTTFVFLAILTKEEISLFIAMMGLVLIFVLKEKAIGFATFVCGIFWFLAMVFLVIPYFSGDGQYWALQWFNPLNGSTSFTSSSLFELISRSTFSRDALNYYLDLLKPFAFLPLLGLPWLILSLPELLINLFSSQAQMRSIMFHYDSGIIPSLVIASIFALKYLNLIIVEINEKLFPAFLENYTRLTFYLVIFLCLIVAVRFNYHYSPLPTTPSCWCLTYKVSKEDIEFDKILKTIPTNASVTASSEVRVHLARRENSFNLPTATSSAEYVAIIDQNRIVGDYSPKEFENALLKDSKFLKAHELISHIGHFYLFKRK